jgi:putative serine protease PepD
VSDRTPGQDAPWAPDGDTEPTQPIQGGWRDPWEPSLPEADAPESDAPEADAPEPHGDEGDLQMPGAFLSETHEPVTDDPGFDHPEAALLDSGLPEGDQAGFVSPSVAPYPTADAADTDRGDGYPVPRHAAPASPFAPPPATSPYHVQPGVQPGPEPWPHTGVLPVAPVPHASRVPVWLWPAVAVGALLLGLVGGAIGGAAYDRLASETSDPVVIGNEPAPLPADNGSVAAVAESLLPSTVQILATYEGEDGGASGSGFVVDRQGHVVTNNHVVADAAGDGRIQIVDQSGNRYDATLVGRSPVYDLAVLYAPEVKKLQPASLGSTTNLRVGDEVVAIGSPLGLTSTVTAGIVSAVDRPVTTGSSADDTSYINAVQTDAAINPGNSGGPLVNLAGQVVGVNSAIATTGGLGGEAGNIGVGFAIPIDQVRTTTEQIVSDGEARYPVIGATVRTGDVGADQPEGAQISEVLDGSPAAQAGLQEGDLVTEIDGQRVSDGIALIVAIRTHQPGEAVELTVERDGREQTLKVTLDSKVG